MSEQVAQEIEVTMKQAQDCIALSDSLERLHKNRDFKKVISECYFKEEPARLVGLKSDPNMQVAEHQEAIIKDIDGIGALQQFFRAIFHRAEWAKQAIEQGQEELVELADED